MSSSALRAKLMLEGLLAGGSIVTDVITNFMWGAPTTPDPNTSARYRGRNESRIVI